MIFFIITIYHSIDQACAPFWQNTGPRNNRESPVGLCAFSGRNLRDFQYTKPCGKLVYNNGSIPNCYNPQYRLVPVTMDKHLIVCLVIVQPSSR